MEINIDKAKADYPNGFSDYLTKYPQDTKKTWSIVMKDSEPRIHNGFNFEPKEYQDMDTWPNEKFWTFITLVEENIENNK